jgi:hypothetical protein
MGRGQGEEAGRGFLGCDCKDEDEDLGGETAHS